MALNTALAQEKINALFDAAKKAGAEDVDILCSVSARTEVHVRGGKAEKLERSENFDIGLRVLIGKRQAVTSASANAIHDVAELAQRAVAMAKSAPEDPFCGLAEKRLLHPPQNMSAPPGESADAMELQDWAKQAEDALRSHPGVTNSDGCGASFSEYAVLLRQSNGFDGRYSQCAYSLSASAIAGTGAGMERDYDFTQSVRKADLRRAADVGLGAAERAVKRLNPRKIDSQKLPVVFDSRASSGLLRYFAGGINGGSIARGTSFLKDKMGKAVFAPGISIIDDPLLEKGMRSRPFDAEAIAASKSQIVKDGVLQSWILDCRSARQLGLETTGHGSRGVSGVPSPSASNFYMAPGSLTPAQLIKDITKGFYVTETMGMGVNMITGDYSQGASGFWIEDGEIAYPVSEVTIAGNLSGIFAAIVPANDLQFRFGVDAPTLRVGEMTLAGK